jgi:hypothetical protein
LAVLKRLETQAAAKWIELGDQLARLISATTGAPPMMMSLPRHAAFLPSGEKKWSRHSVVEVSKMCKKVRESGAADAIVKEL